MVRRHDHQVAVSSSSSWGGRRISKEHDGGCAQEGTNAGRGSTSGGAFIERAKKRVVLAEYVQWAKEWKVEVGCEKELAEAEERLSPTTRPSNGGATSARAV